MSSEQNYAKACLLAIFLHSCLALALLLEPANQRPVMEAANSQVSPVLPVNLEAQPQEQMVKAVSVDNQEVMETVNRLKQERNNQLKAEQARQNALMQQADMARKQRLEEQQQLAKLKEETEKIAIARKKQIEEETRRLQELALQKQQEVKRLEALKTKQRLLEKQQEEAKKQAALKKKQALEKAALENAKMEKIKAEKAKAEELARLAKANAELAEQKRQAAIQQAALDAAKKAQMAGVVDKYKAMIVNAISQRWILPEQVEPGLSSQFRIRLAPGGEVLDVNLTRSSGDPILDRSAQTAIYKASPLPVPNDPEMFNLFRDISLTVRPENVRG